MSLRVSLLRRRRGALLRDIADGMRFGRQLAARPNPAFTAATSTDLDFFDVKKAPSGKK